MQLTMLKSKLHRVRVTAAELEYEGSCAIDAALMAAADILPFEQLQIYNVSNGERFTTYAIVAAAGSGTISVNGAAAHRAAVGDLLIVCTYATMDGAQAREFQPTTLFVDGDNGAR
ncbi:MAG: aspartate 1-decarboxylase [Mariprofundales bacterium]|nr:aspartate 1-decarboxylase [Mariprofundales bacterium]